MQSPRHLAARDYAKQGIPVFPCLPGSKQPATENGFHDASCSLAQVDAWWAVADYNLALSPEAAGWAIMDLDGGEVGEASLTALEGEYGAVPETFEVETPTGGRHLYFCGTLPPTVNRLGPKIDTRGRGSYVLVPPSVVDARGEPDKPEKWGSYSIVVDAEIADLPAWVDEALTKTVARQEVAYDFVVDLPANIARAVAKLKSLPEVTQGGGADARTYEAAAFMHDLGLSPEKALEVMLEHFKCSPQDDRYEPFLRRKIESAWRYSQNDAGAWGVDAPPAEVFGAALDKLLTPELAGRKPEFYPFTLDELAGEPPLEWLIPDLIPHDGFGMIYGPPKTFKTFLVIATIMPVAMERDVIYVAGEGARLISGRARAWCTAHDRDYRGSRLRVVKEMPHAADPERVHRFVAEIKGRGVKPALVVIDTAARNMLGLDEQSSKDIGLFVSAMDYIKEQLKCAVLVVHHTGKDASRGARGSSALLGAVDFSAEVSRHEMTLAVELRVRAMKDAAEREQPWTYEGRQVAGTLVLMPTSREQHEAATKGRDVIRPELVALKLGELGAVSEGDGVSTHVLAEQMLAPLEGETVEQREEGKARLARSLNAEANGKLAAFAHGPSRALKWWKP